MATLNEDISHLLGTYFGSETSQMIEAYYNSASELIDISMEMLTKLLGPIVAEKELTPIIKRYNLGKGRLK